MTAVLAGVLLACDPGATDDPASSAEVAPEPAAGPAATAAEVAAASPRPAPEAPAADPSPPPEAPAAPEPKPIPVPEPEPEPVFEVGEGKSFPVSTPLLKRLDGTGKPMLGTDLLDPDAIATHLDLPARRTGSDWVFGRKALRQSISRDVVTLEVTGEELATPAGVHPGMSLDELRAAVPDLECTPEGGADGEFVHCPIDAGFIARIHSKYDAFYDLPYGVLSDADLKKAVGKARVEALELWASGAPKPATAVASKETGVLAAGNYGEPYVAGICSLEEGPAPCELPAAAVIADIVDADRAVAEAERHTAAAPGYPWLAHTDELAITSDAGVAVVLGLFASEAAAEAWRNANATSAKVVVVAPPGSDPGQVVVRMRAGKPVAARATADAAASGRGEVSCTLDGGQVVVTSHDEALREAYRAIAVACPDGRSAWVAWRDTQLWTMTGDRAGRPAQWQVVGAECDQPSYARWALNADGARSSRPKEIAGDDC